MKKHFDTHRTTMLLGSEIARSYRVMISVFAGFWLMPFALLIPFPQEPSNDGTPLMRFCYMAVTAICLTAIIPGLLYNDCNHKGKGSLFALLPASKCEKFVCMELITIIILPMIFCIGALLADMAVYLIPGTPYKEPIWNLSDLGRIHILMPKTLLAAVSIATGQVFLYTNTLFQRYKPAWTLLCITIAGAAAVFAALAASVVWPQLSIKHLIFNTPLLLLVLTATTLLFGWGTWRRLKRMEY